MKSIVEFAGNVSINSELLDNVKDNVSKLHEIKIEIKNSEIDFYYFYIALLYYENGNFLNKLIDVCDEADELMNSNHHIITNNRKTVILLYRVKALLRLKYFDLALQTLQNFDKVYLPTENLYNWYILKETEFKLYLQDNKIKEAYKVHEQVLDNKSFKRQVAQLN
jgi:tetratricopeptide (TPR) repeat protein